MNIQQIKSIIDKKKGIYSHLESQLQAKQDEKLTNEIELQTLEKAQIFLQTIAQKTQEQLKYHVSDIVQLALDTLFPNQYIFDVKFDIKYGKTEAELLFIKRDTGMTIDPMQASGGGVVDLASFALRIACYTLEQGIDNVIILDEPFKFISADLRVQAAEVVSTLSKKLNLQFIMVTHLPELTGIADKVFIVKKNSKGISRITEQRGSV